MNNLEKEAILKIGEVFEVDGRKVLIEVARKKNSSDIFFDGVIIKNVAVNSFIEIRKGFLSIIGKVEGEKIEENETLTKNASAYNSLDKNRRILIVSLFGYVDKNRGFVGGTEELPLVGNEAFILKRDKIALIHSTSKEDIFSISVCSNEAEEIDIKLPIDGLFNSHIAIFGNTGTGKSNTLASLYGALTNKLSSINSSKYRENCRFLLLDFNGEYTKPECITNAKKICNLSTRKRLSDIAQNDKILLGTNDFLDVEILSILASATDKTQKPFLARAINLYKSLRSKTSPTAYIKKTLRNILTEVLTRKDDSNPVIIDFIISMLPPRINAEGLPSSLVDDLFLSYGKYIFASDIGQNNPTITTATATRSILYGHIDSFTFDHDSINFMDLLHILKLQLIQDIQHNRAQKDHIAPVISRLEKHQEDIEKVINFSSEDFWGSNNFMVINLEDVNLDMKKTLPLLLAKKVYSDHKKEDNRRSLSIIIDEAHNILSRQSTRETESWKDYRLETFEEIIKEGRKFGVFLTISSQRPNDISDTIISQAHNYFIHKLLNQRDLQMVENAVSYIDDVTKESIPNLPTGVCIFSGTASQMPLKIRIKELPEAEKPESNTLKYKDIIL